MIDPEFEKRLLNWGARAKHQSQAPGKSPMVGVMEAVRLQKGNPDGFQLAPSRGQIFDNHDADILDRAYSSPTLPDIVKRIVRLKYCHPLGADDTFVAWRCRIPTRSFPRHLEAAVAIFQEAVEALDKTART